MKFLKRLLGSLLLVAAVVGLVVWQMNPSKSDFPDIASGDGRIEATEIDVATKLQGRIESVLVHEGDMVRQGQILARMDARVLEAELHQAEAEQRRAQEERNVAIATIAQAILYRGAGLDVVWPDFAAVTAIGAVYFLVAGCGSEKPWRWPRANFGCSFPEGTLFQSG